ncbi:MAG TPA: hypothetical protein VFI33_04235 [Puia sp.]|nr:hypothetical protein [Puia sp.]
MIFELISWIYISLVCLSGGNRILKLFFGIKDVSGIDFPVICLIGMSAFGIITFYLSLVVPLFTVIKLSLQFITLLSLVKEGNRKEISSQLKNCFGHLTAMGITFLTISVIMVLIISSAPVIHPDTLNYHAFSTLIFDRFGVLTGIANLKPELGFQSLWFAALAFFHFTFSNDILVFPLNGCVMLWTIILLVLGTSAVDKSFSSRNAMSKRIWYLILILFAIFSWTQIRLTAASLSPDFIAAIYIFLAFYFFSGTRGLSGRKYSDLMAVFFSAIAVSVKLSAIPILLIPCIIAGKWIVQRRYLLVVRAGIIVVLLLTPIIVRNLLSTGYPIYPSSFPDFYKTDWKVEKSTVLDFQKYITAYARYPVLRAQSAQEYDKSLVDWLPLWWDHLYLVDRALVIVIMTGILLNFLFLKTIRRAYSRRLAAGLMIAMVGTVFWFVNAPDPRFGTGFLIPLVYFLYFPFVEHGVKNRIEFMEKVQNGIVKITTLLILIYIGYRGVYFFHPRQWLIPEGIKQISKTQDDCDANIKRMVLNNSIPLRPPADSCINFRFRGSTIQEGFGPR